jgi:hypothetical protein
VLPTPRVQPVQPKPAVPPQTQKPSPLLPPRPAFQEQGKGTPGGNPAAPGAGRQQRSLNDLRGIRGMGRRQDDVKDRSLPADEDQSNEPVPFLRQRQNPQG